MPMWWVFPPRSPVRLHYHSQPGGAFEYVVRAQLRDPRPPAFWRPVPAAGGGMWRMAQSDAAAAARWFRLHGGELKDMPAADIRRRYQLQDCPRTAAVVGVNARGEEIREHDGRRWHFPAEPDPSWESWAGAEMAWAPQRSLRFGTEAAFRQLAESLVNRAARGQKFPSDLPGLAAALADPGQRPSFQPLAGPAEAHRLLLQEIAAAGIARAAEPGGPPQWTRADRLDRLLGDLSVSGEAELPLRLQAVMAAAAGPLNSVRLLRPGMPSGAGWDRHFSRRANTGATLFDARGMELGEAAGRLTEMAEAGEFPDGGPGGESPRLVALLPGPADHPDVLAARRQIARTRGIEAAAELPADGISGADGAVTLISVGAVREAPLPEPPPQAMRLIRTEEGSPGWTEARQWLTDTAHGRSRLAGEDASDGRQVPYQPLGRLGEARCTISRAHSSPARAAGRKAADKHGELHARAGYLLGLDDDQLLERYSPEQMDAVVMADAARRRGRAFLLGDQTGTGKGRALAGAAVSWLREHPENRVIYLTVTAQVSLDVLRDLRATGALEHTGRPLLLGNEMPLDADADRMASASAGGRAMMRAGWPEGRRLVVGLYSGIQAARFDNPEASESRRLQASWLAEACASPRTMLILDESHKALARQGNTGWNLRAACEAAARVMFSSATALRSHLGLGLYRRLFPPDMSDTRFERIRDGVRSGGETAQESLVTMLVEDGVVLRRDHDTGLVPYSVETPSEEQRLRGAELMSALQPVAEQLALCQAASVERLADIVHELWNRHGAPRGQAEDEFNRALDAVYRQGFGSPLTEIAEAALSALKVTQTVELCRRELSPSRSRKPMVSLSRTAGSFLGRAHSGETELPADRPPDLRDHILHIAERVFIVPEPPEPGHPPTGERIDLREAHPPLGDMWQELRRRILALPASLPVSPVDALIDGLAEHGITAGEITGREHRLLPSGEVVRRERQPKEETARAFNDGAADVLIYNSAGGTGASYHASAEFLDQRPRTIIQMELPTDVLGHLQSMGRGNRFDQVASPEFITVSTDTVPEQRLLAMNNAKLRSVGAILDADRNHPALAEDIPDLYNAVGEAAARQVLADLPAMAERLGLRLRDRFPGDPRPAAPEGLVRKLFARAILLPPDEQERLFRALSEQHRFFVAEHEARGDSPLRVPQLAGHIEVVSSEPYAVDGAEADGEDSVFYRPLQLTGAAVQHLPPGLSGNRVAELAAQGAEALAARPEDSPVAQGRALTARLPELRAAAEAGGGGRGRFDENRFRSLTGLLAQLEPGAALAFPGFRPNHVVLGYRPPPAHSAHRASSHVFTVARAGEPKPVSMSAARLLEDRLEPSGRNVFDETGGGALPLFDRMARSGLKRPVQVLTGNMVSVAEVVARNRSRHFRICSFTDQNGRSRRAAVVTDPKEINLERMPFRISARGFLDAAASWSGFSERLSTPPSARQQTADSLSHPDRTPTYLISLRSSGRDTIEARLPPLTKTWLKSFWSAHTGPALYRELTGKDLPGKAPKITGRPEHITAELRVAGLDSEAQLRRAERICRLIDAHPQSDLLASGGEREWWSREGAAQAAARRAEWQSLSSAREAAAEIGLGNGGLAADPPPLRFRSPGGEISVRFLSGGGEPEALLEMPDFDRSGAAAWKHSGMRSLWPLAARPARKLPEKPAPFSGRRMAAYLEGDDCVAALRNLSAAADDGGWEAAVDVSGRAEPVRRLEPAA